MSVLGGVVGSLEVATARASAPGFNEERQKVRGLWVEQGPCQCDVALVNLCRESGSKVGQSQC